MQTETATTNMDFNDCTICGGLFASDDLIELEGMFICAGCKPVMVQRLQEGFDLAEITPVLWRNVIVAGRQARFPRRCYRCNSASDLAIFQLKVKSMVQPFILAVWLVVAPVIIQMRLARRLPLWAIGAFCCVFLISLIRFSWHVPWTVCLCNRHRRWLPRAKILSWVLCLLGVGILQCYGWHHRQFPWVLAGVVLTSLSIVPAWFAPQLRIIKSRRNRLVLHGSGHAFRQSLPEIKD